LKTTNITHISEHILLQPCTYGHLSDTQLGLSWACQTMHGMLSYGRL